MFIYVCVGLWWVMKTHVFKLVYFFFRLALFYSSANMKSYQSMQNDTRAKIPSSGNFLMNDMWTITTHLTIDKLNHMVLWFKWHILLLKCKLNRWSVIRKLVLSSANGLSCKMPIKERQRQPASQPESGEQERETLSQAITENKMNWKKRKKKSWQNFWSLESVVFEL